MAQSPVALPSITAPYACVISSTGAVLYAKAKDTQHRQASTTKLMTSYVACQRAAASDSVTCQAALMTGGSESVSGESTAGLATGEVLTTAQLLIASMFPSGADAARTLAGYVGGTYLGAADTAVAGQTAFVAEMNVQAAALGMTNSAYVNPSGNATAPSGTLLTGHYSSAYDLCLNMRAMMNLSGGMADAMRAAFLLGGSNVITSVTTRHYDHSGVSYPAILGAKGGSWNGGGIPAFWSYVLCAQRGTHTVYAAVIQENTDTRAVDLRWMLDYAFDQLNEYTIATSTVQDGMGIITPNSWTRSGSFPANYSEAYAFFSATTNASLSCTMTGKTFRVFMPKSSNRGIVGIYFDNVFQTNVDLYAPSWTLASAGAVWETTVGSAGAHTVKLVCTGTKNATSTGVTVDLDYFQYEDLIEPPPATSGVYVPGADVTDGGWTAIPGGGTSLFPVVDELVASDLDYAQSSNAPVADTIEVKYTGVGAPSDLNGHLVEYRIRGDVGTKLTVSYVCGTTIIKSWVHDPAPLGFTTFSQPLTQGEAASVADYSDLRLRVVADVIAGTVTPPPTSEVVQYQLFDGPSGPTRFYSNTKIGVNWIRNGGDWLDASTAHTVNGTAANYGTFTQGPSPNGIYVAKNISSAAFISLVQRWLDTGDNRGVFLKWSSGSAFPIYVAGRQHTDPTKAPSLVVTTEAGTYTCPVTATCTTNLTVASFQDGRARMLVSQNDSGMLQFDLSPIQGATISAAVMTLNIYRMDGSSVGSYAIYELNLPFVQIGGGGGTVVKGLSELYPNDIGMDADPNVYWSSVYGSTGGAFTAFGVNWRNDGGFDIGGPGDLSRVQYLVDPDTGEGILESGFGQLGTPNAIGAAQLQRYVSWPITSGEITANKPDVVVNEMWFRYYVKFDADWGASEPGYPNPNDGYKMAGICGQFGKWTPNGAYARLGGYWEPETGNGGSQTTGLYVVETTFTWNQVAGNQGYHVKWGTTSGVYTNTQNAATNVTVALIAGLIYGTTYFFRVYPVVGGVEQTPAAETSFVAGTTAGSYPAFEGWSFRGHGGPGMEDGNPYDSIFRMRNYCYHIDMPSAFGDLFEWGTHIKKEVWYCIEQHVKVNTIDLTSPDAMGNGTARFDGVLEIWIDGVKMNLPPGPRGQAGWRMTHHPAFGITNGWQDWYHGGITGQSEPSHEIHFQIKGMVLAKQYIGPRKIPGAPIPDWVPTVPGTLVDVSPTVTQYKSQCPPGWATDTHGFLEIPKDQSAVPANPYWGTYGCLLAFGGGHSGTSNNSVVILELQNTSSTVCGQWKRITDPVPWDVSLQPWDTFKPGTFPVNPDVANSNYYTDYTFGEYRSAAGGSTFNPPQPTSGHAWSCGDFIPPSKGGGANGSFISVVRQACSFDSNPVAVLNAHRLDFADTTGPFTWTRAATAPGSASSFSVNTAGTSTVYDPDLNRVWFTGSPTTTQSNFVGYFDVATGQYLKVTFRAGAANRPAGGGTFDTGSLGYDPVQKAIVWTAMLALNAQPRFYYLKTTDPAGGWTRATMVGDALPVDGGAGPPFNKGYCPVTNKWYMFCTRSADVSHVYEVSIPADITQNWPVFARPLLGMNYPGTAWISGTMNWLPACNCFVFHQFDGTGTQQPRIYAFRPFGT